MQYFHKFQFFKFILENKIQNCEKKKWNLTRISYKSCLHSARATFVFSLIVLMMELADGMRIFFFSSFPMDLTATALSSEDRSDAKLRRRHFSWSDVVLREEDITSDSRVGLTNGTKRCNRGTKALIYAKKAPSKSFK